MANGAAGGRFNTTIGQKIKNFGAQVESVFNLPKGDSLIVAVGQTGRNPCDNYQVDIQNALYDAVVS